MESKIILQTQNLAQEAIALDNDDLQEDKLLYAPTKHSPWFKYLDEKYKISEDSHIIYRNGIYKIEPQSPFWGIDCSWF